MDLKYKFIQPRNSLKTVLRKSLKSLSCRLSASGIQLKFSISFNNLLIIELAAPLASGGNNSDIMSKGIGPYPIEKAMINKQSELNGKKWIFDA